MSAQPLLALSAANQNRLGMSQVRAEMRAGLLTAIGALDDPRAQPMPLGRLLRSQPKWGDVKARYVLRELMVSEQRRVRDLTDRQRDALREILARPQVLSAPRLDIEQTVEPPSRRSQHASDVLYAEGWKRRAQLLDQAIRVHQRMIQGPGPTAEFGEADSVLWAARDAIVKGRA